MNDSHFLRTIADLKPGDHLCCMYETEAEHRAVLTPFLRQGLEQHEKVFYIVDAHTAETVLGYLRDDGVDVDAYIQRGQLAMLTRHESYIQDGVFDPDRMIATLRAETARALGEGYTALRVTGEMTWALQGFPGSERLIEYETKLNELFPGSQCLALCQYDRQRFSPEILLDVLRTHPIAVIGTEVYQNFYYIPPDQLLGGEMQAAELQQWMQNLVDRERTEEALRESEERFRTIAENFPNGAVVLFDHELRYIAANGAILQEVGLSGDMMVGKTVREVLPPDKCEELEPYYRFALNGEVCTFEYIFADRIFTVYTLPIRDRDGHVVAGMSMSQDITERKRAEEALRGSERELRRILEATTDGIWTWDFKTDKLFFSAKYYTMMGYRPNAFSANYENWVNLIHPDDRKKALSVAEEYLKTKPDLYENEFRLKTKKGDYQWIRTRARVVERDENGNAVYMIGNHEDITERKQAEEALRESEEKHRLLFETMVQGVVYQDAEGQIISANPAAERLLGLSLDQMLGRTSVDPRWHAIHEDGSEFSGETHPSMVVLRTGEEVRNVVMGVFNPQTDQYRWLNIHAIPQFRPGEDAPYQVYTTFDDITERKLAKEKLQKSESLLKEAQRVAHIGHWELDPDIGTPIWSDEIFRIFDLDPQKGEPSFINHETHTHPDDWPLLNEAVTTASKDGTPFDINFRIVRPSGEIRWMHAIGTTSMDAEGNVTRLFGTAQDITERKRAEERLKQSLREKEVLLQELYHRTKNNMGVIGAMMSMQAENLDDQRLIRILEELKQRILSMAMVHEQLYESQDLSHVNLRAYTQQLVGTLLANYQVGASKIALKVEVEPIVVLIETAIPYGLIVNELMTNALKYAFPEGRDGEIRIALHRLPEEQELELRFCDNGIGLPKGLDIRKTDSFGMQLITLLIDVQFDGTLDVQVNNGTEFRIRFQELDYTARV